MHEQITNTRMMYYYSDFVPFHLFGFILMLLFWGLLIWGAVALFRHGGFLHSGGHRALDILKERYAKGEITKEQFEAMKKDMQ